MKKLFIGAAMAMSFVGLSQSKYFSISVGYGLGVPGLSTYESTGGGFGQGTDKVKHVNLGGGINASVSYGLSIFNNAHLDLGIGYQNNLGSSIEDTYYNMIINPGGIPAYEEEKYINTIKTSSFRFTPSLRFYTGEGTVRAFVKAGPQFILTNFKIENESQSSGNTSYMETKVSPTFQVGAASALGVEFELSENILLTASIDACLAYVSPNKSEVVVYEENGQNMLPFLTTSEKETEFKKELSDADYYGSPDQPSKELKQRVDFSQVGFNIGVRVIL